MKTCGQTETQSVLEHGISVKNYLFDLIDHLESEKPLKYEWRIPQWLIDNKELILGSLPSRKTLKLATIMHDCGKPFCIQFDDEGRRHFPNHAQKSHDIFVQLYEDKIAAHLILHDMDIHLLKADGVEEFAKSPYALTHLLIGLAEIHSNARMFGGIDSTSFKIKYKSLDSRAKQIIKTKKS
jgi:hypothetical protein